MTEKQDPPSGLLSKVVRFVRNPTVSWTDLDAIDADRQGDYSKQVLKERIERSRDNDLVRRREFDQLRKLRQRGFKPGPQAEDPAARPSFFHSSLTAPGNRAGTLKKIDEIEAQMSQQWWKTEGAKRPAAASAAQPDASKWSKTPTSQHGPAVPPPPREVVEALKIQDANHARLRTQDTLHPSPAGGDRVGTAERIKAEPSLGHAQPLPGAGPAPAAPVQVAPMQAAPVQVAPMPVAPLAVQPAFVHHPDLEEAAIRFANGDYVGAESSLKEVLEQHAKDEPAQLLELWRTLFDLYRATGQHDAFEVAGIQFAAQFDRSPPLWFSMPEQLGLESTGSGAVAGRVQREFSWNAPPTITVPTLTALQAAMGRAAPPWKFTWSRVSAIDADALLALAKKFTQWADQTDPVAFIGADQLLALLEARTPSGDRQQNQAWWHLRMAALRLMGQPDEFEMVALDYCVTYEVSPPSWMPAKCPYQDDSDAARTVAMSGDAGVAQASGESPSPSPAGQTPEPPEAVVDGLVGVIEGDPNTALDEVVAQTSSYAVLRVPCERLVRIDFSAAGAVLNWAAEQKSDGRVVEFVQLHRLVAAFFNLVGIGEYGTIVVRKD